MQNTSPGLDECKPEAHASPLHWSGTIRDLVELIYALYHSKCLNNGKVSLRDLAVIFEGIFGVKVGNLYHCFSKVRLRKKDRASFIKKLYDNLIENMDEMDG